MANKSFSRRNFIAGVASTAAAVALPQIASAADNNPVSADDQRGQKKKLAPLKF